MGLGCDAKTGKWDRPVWGIVNHDAGGAEIRFSFLMQIYLFRSRRILQLFQVGAEGWGPPNSLWALAAEAPGLDVQSGQIMTGSS